MDWLWDKASSILGGIRNFFGGIGDFFGGVGDFFSGGAKVNNTASSKTINNSAGNGGNRTNNINQRVEVNNTFNAADFPTMQTANKATTDVVGDLTDTFKFAK